MDDWLKAHAKVTVPWRGCVVTVVVLHQHGNFEVSVPWRGCVVTLQDVIAKKNPTWVSVPWRGCVVTVRSLRYVETSERFRRLAGMCCNLHFPVNDVTALLAFPSPGGDVL